MYSSYPQRGLELEGFVATAQGSDGSPSFLKAQLNSSSLTVNKVYNDKGKQLLASMKMFSKWQKWLARAINPAIPPKFL